MQAEHAALNAALNLASTALLVSGYRAIRRREVDRHRRRMLAALAVSVLFLISYLARMAGAAGTKEFPDAVPWVRVLYLAILAPHVILAAFVPFLALRTVFLAHKERFEEHRRLARWTFPIWMFVSVTGVVVYLMAYHLAPALEGA